MSSLSHLRIPQTGKTHLTMHEGSSWTLCGELVDSKEVGGKVEHASEERTYRKGYCMTCRHRHSINLRDIGMPVERMELAADGLFLADSMVG